MKAVLLAGGRGERLRPLTGRTPKPLCRLCGKEVILYAIEALERAGVEDIILTLGDRAEQFEAFFAQKKLSRARIRLVAEEKPLGTAGSVAALGLEEETLILGGDLLFSLDLASFIAFHRRTRAAASLLLTRSGAPTEYGVVRAQSDGRVVSFSEKPDWPRVCTDTINTGIYLLSPEALARIPQGVCDFGHDFFPQLLEQGEPLYAQVQSGYWRDIGSLPAFLACQREILGGALGEFSPIPAEPRPGVTFLQPVWLGRDCVIGEGSVLGPNFAADDGCTLGRGCLLQNSRLGREVRLGKEVAGQGAVLADSCRLGDGVTLAGGTALGDGCEVSEGVALSGEKLEPGAQVRVSPSSVELHSFGLSGELGREIHVPLAARLGAALAAGQKGSVLVGWDDPAGERLGRALAAALTEGGRDVFFEEGAPAPLIRFLGVFCYFPLSVSFVRLGERMEIRLTNENGLAPSLRPLEKALEHPGAALPERPGKTGRLFGGKERYFRYAEKFGAVARGVRVECPSPALKEAAERLLKAHGAPEGEELVWSLSSGGDRFSLRENGIDYPDTRLLPLLLEGRTYAPGWLPRLGLPGVIFGEADGYRVSPEHFDAVLATLALLARLGQKPLSEALKARPGVRLCSARVPVDNRAAAMGRLCEQLPLAREDEGLRLFLDGGEVRVSPSAHAEELRVVAAGVREETARELCARAEKLIRSGALDKKEETGYN